MIWKGRHFRFDLLKKKPTLIMGILNITPDSFSDGMKYLNPNAAYLKAVEMQQAGADIIDIGAESTRPGSCGVSAEDELRRIMPVLHTFRKKSIRIPISIDTSKACVAEACLKEGAAIINDISGLKRDKHMAAIVKKYDAGIVLMHMRGVPATMQRYTVYDSLISEIKKELAQSIRIARTHKIPLHSIVIDPGIGFAKTAEQNIAIINAIDKFHSLKRPILLGPSRKSFIGYYLKQTVDQRLGGTLAAIAYGIQHGVHIVRVHDVKIVKDIVTMLHIIKKS